MMISDSPSAHAVCADNVEIPSKVKVTNANALKRVDLLENDVIRFIVTVLQVSITFLLLQLTKYLTDKL